MMLNIANMRRVHPWIMAVFVQGIMSVAGYGAEQSHEWRLSRSKEDLRGFHREVRFRGGLAEGAGLSA